MPCNCLAVRPGQLQTNIAHDVLTSPQAIQAVQRLLAGLLACAPEAVTIYNEQHDWANGWSQYRDGLPVTQTVPVSQLAGGMMIDWVHEKLAVRLNANGELTYRDGWDLHRPMQGMALEQIKAQLEPLLEQLGMALAQQKTIAAIKAAGHVTSEQWTNAGVCVLKVRV